MSTLSKAEIIQILSKAYNIEPKDIKEDTICYFKDIANDSILISVANTPEGIPYEELLNGTVDINTVAEEMGLTIYGLKKKLYEYCIIAQVTDYKVKIKSLKNGKGKADENEL